MVVQQEELLEFLVEAQGVEPQQECHLLAHLEEL
jgi:hypothetical protein